VGFTSLWVIPIALASIVGSRRLSGTRRSWLLIVSSVSFYAALDVAALPLMAAVIFTSWMGGRTLERRRGALLLAVVVSATLWPLLLSKYLPWLLHILQSGHVWIVGDLGSRGVPPGLSFVTLQAVGYLVDVSRQRITATHSLRDHALFLAFFPQLVAGPIERTEALRPQLETPRRPSASEYYGALKLALLGYALKLVVADALAEPIERLLRLPAQEAPAGLLFALPLFSSRLYLDFYAYSCIAVALGHAHGVQLTMNFANPYGATSLGDFWRRWHVSLSSWWRDYVYLPLGGRRRGLVRESLAIFVVFLLSGLWHGAGLGFFLWGACHGGGLLVERVCRRAWGARHPPFLEPISSIISGARTLGTVTFVTVCWLPFLTSAERPAPVLFGRMLQAGREVTSTTAHLRTLAEADGWVLVLAVLGALCAHRMEQWYWARPRTFRFWIVSDVAVTNALVLSLLLFGDFGGRTFIYFAF
jgi:D-alanyl-lipoteichoic acid acyltransferase DltB (MBOAT superfamily)